MRRLPALVLFLLTLLLTNIDTFAAFDSASVNSSTEPLKLLRVTPSGVDVPPGRQIVFTFNRPVVPVGRMERDPSEIPVTIKPALDCEWRWLNTSSLACQLDEKSAMKPSTSYSITMRPGIKAEDGSVLQETFTDTFITQRPKVTSSWFKTWKSPGTPVINVNFDQYVTESSLREHLYFRTRGGERWASKVEEDPDYKKIKGYKKGRLWLVSPADELPGDEGVELIVEKGVISTEGPEPGAEEKVIVSFNTIPEFRFLGVECWKNNARKTLVSPDEKEPEDERCDPLGYISLVFSAPIIKEALKEGLVITPDLAGGRSDFDPWAEVYSYSNLSSPHVKGERYTVRLPGLKAYEEYRLAAKAGRIRDEFGRPLDKDIEMVFMTDHRRPDFHLSSQFFVLEKNVDSDVPMVVTNMEKIEFKYDTVTSRGKDTGKRSTLRPEKAEDVAYRIPLGIREKIPASTGAIEASFDTGPSIRHKGPRDRWFFAQVSPYNIHVKAGHYNTLVWVTDFSTGLPVPGVKVDVYKDAFNIGGLVERIIKNFKQDNEIGEVLTTGVTDSNGIAVLEGTEKIDPSLKLLNGYYWSWQESAQLFVRASKKEDVAFLPLISQFNVEERGANDQYIGTYLERRYGHIHTWGTTAQGVYKAGDTVQYKFYVRDQDNKAFVPAPREHYTLKVADPMDKIVHEVKDITLSEFGAYDGEFTVPKTGAVGWYTFRLSSSFTRESWQPMRVLVSDFTPAPFRVTTDLNGELFGPGDTVKVQTSARLHAGGPYADAGTRVTARLQGRRFVPKDPKAKGFSFGAFQYRYPVSTINQTESSVDSKGELKSEFTIGESPVLYGRLTVESAVRDDRGKYVAGSARATYVGRDRYVGIRQGDWFLKEDEPAKVEAIVVNESGKAVGGTPIDFKIEYRKTTASRVKGAGNAYITQYNHEWVEAGGCRLTSTAGPVECVFTPENAGTYRIEAAIKDTLGRRHSSVLSRWVVGKGRVLWETRTGNTLDIFPEKDDYKIGEKARFLVKNPYPGARALVTIERFGVIKSWVETFEDSTELVEFKVLPEYLPGYYLSIVVFSPRVDKPIDENQVDLGKPSFKMGYVRVPVKDPYRELQIKVTPEKEVYKPGDEVTVDLSAEVYPPPAGKKQPPMEIAVAVLDESVFDLIPSGKTYFDPYKGFYYLDPLDLKNFSLLMQLVGRQKFEKKGANAGGDGGMDLGLRSLFKFVSYWNPSIKTDKDGRARVSFKVPDNLTGWRVLAMAVTDSSRMGLGDSVFKVNRPTEIRPALPNHVTEGDSFQAGFTVMNRTDKKRTLNVEISAIGPLEGGTILKRESVTAEPYKRYKVWLPVKTVGDGVITFEVRASDKLDADAMRMTMTARKRASLEVAATYGTTTSNMVEETIAFPKGIRTDVGKVSIVASPTVIGNLEGAFEYMRDYPYICWEQILTKGVMAAHYMSLKQYMPRDFEWKESAGLPEKTLRLAAEHQAPNGGMVYYIPQNRYVSPYLSAYTAIAFNWLRESGYKIPHEVEMRLHEYLLNLLKRDVMPSFYSNGMSSTVRAVALAALAPHGKIDSADLKRYWRHVDGMSLFGKAHYLKALLSVKGTEKMRSDIVKMILSHSNQTGGKFIFSEAADSGYERILATPLRDNCAVLSSLLEYSESSSGGDALGDIPFKLLRTITQTRGGRSRWENTQENMFCLNSVTEYSRVYEKVAPKMKLKAWLGEEPMGDAAFSDFRDDAVEFERPIKSRDPGRKVKARLERKGAGRVYYSTRLFYAPSDLKARSINSGIEVRREYSVERDGKWVLLDRKMKLKTGELVRVDIFVSLPAARNFVVVEDPVPGGLEPVNRELATSSGVDADKGEFKHAGGSFWFKRDDWLEYGYSRWSFYHKELRHHAVRFYSEYLPAGNYHLSYVAQSIAPGEFSVLPLHAEEMYDPDVFGKGLPASLDVKRGD